MFTLTKIECDCMKQGRGRPRKYEDRGKYMAEYMQKRRSFRKAKHDLQENHENAIIERFVKPPTEDFLERSRRSNLMTIVFASLFTADRIIREIDNLDEVDKIYKDLWKELETHEAKLKEM